MKVTSFLLALVSIAAAVGPGIIVPTGDVNSVADAAPAVLSGRSVEAVKRETNADRFARGLKTPIKPTRSRARNGALRPRTSCLPLANNEGTIAVSHTGGAAVGFISSTYDSQNSYTIGATALTVTLPSTTPFSGVFDITAVNGPDAGHPNVGAVGGSGGFNFGSHGYAYLSGTGSTPANSPPSSSAGTSIQTLGYDGPAESDIWSLDCATLEFTAQWTNADNTQLTTVIFYDPVVNYIGLTGNLATYNSDYGDGAYEVTLTFIPA